MEKHIEAAAGQECQKSTVEEKESPEGNQQKPIQECREMFLTPDFIMEPGIFKQLLHFLQLGGSTEEVIIMLSQNYKGVAQMVNLLRQWLTLAGVSDIDVQQIIENHLRNLILKTFDPKKADTIFTVVGATPDWLTEMIQHRMWRSLIYRLAEKYPNCLMLNFTIKLISDAGFHSEITSASIAAQQIEVFPSVLKTSISKYLQNPDCKENAMEECARLACQGQHTYVLSQVLIQELSQEPEGGFNMKRLSQDIAKYALENNRNVTPINMALYGAAAYPRVCEALSSMLTSKRLNPADITVLFHNYSAADPPPIDFIRNPQFLDLLVDSLFGTGAKINPNHKSKYVYLLAYAVAVVDTGAPGKQSPMSQRVIKKDELESTIQTIEKVHEICNVNLSSKALIAKLEMLFDCIKYPVIGMGVIRWIEITVTDPSYFKLSTESCQTHLAILDEVAVLHETMHQQILQILTRLFESTQSEMETLAQLEMKKMLLDRMVHLLTHGCVVPVVKYVKQCYDKGDTDISLIRYFVAGVLDTIMPPYSTEFVKLFLPLVENKEIRDIIAAEGDNDPVEEFIVHCRTHHANL